MIEFRSWANVSDDLLAMYYVAAQASLTELPENALAYGVRLRDDGLVELVFQMSEVTPDDKEWIDGIGGEFELSTACKIDFNVITDVRPALALNIEPAVEWIWAANGG